MRMIDADALVAKMNLAIALIKNTMKNFDLEDDPECQMELKAYQDIRNGIKEEPTIEPEPHWIPNTRETVPKDPLRKQIQLKNSWIITGWFDGEDWFPVPEVGASLLFDNVLAWCELPEPYQPESEE